MNLFGNDSIRNESLVLCLSLSFPYPFIFRKHSERNRFRIEYSTMIPLMLQMLETFFDWSISKILLICQANAPKHL